MATKPSNPGRVSVPAFNLLMAPIALAVILLVFLVLFQQTLSTSVERLISLAGIFVTTGMFFWSIVS